MQEPSVENCSEYLKEKSNEPENEHYSVQGKVTQKLFSQHPNNTDLEEILLKAAVLNDFYSTEIKDIYSVAKVLFELKIDSKLKKGDLNLVNEIAIETAKKCKSGRHEYVFASKYCALHKPEIYPILDSKAVKALWTINEKFHFSNFKKSEITNRKKYPEFYIRYCEIYKDFIERFNLQPLPLLKIDSYLWKLGKDILRK